MKKIVLTLLMYTTAASAQTVSGQLRTENLYRAFFRHITFLQTQAATLTENAPNRASILSYYQTVLSLSNADAAILKGEAVATDTEIGLQDKRAQEIINGFRKQYTPGLVDGPLPKAAAR